MAIGKKRSIKKCMTTVISIILVLAVIIGLFGYIVPAYFNAKNIGISVGARTGTIVGKVIGSFDGISTGLKKGYKNGKEEGLSAKDTKAEIKNRCSEIGNLEVLEAGIKLKNVNVLGDDYAALYLLKGVAVYSVNLKDVDINDLGSDTIEVLLPEITVDIYIDESSTEKLAEYQKHSWSGSASDGLKEYMNTRSASDQSVKDTIENYPDLMEAAQSSAIKQIEIIAKTATANKKDIVVNFKEVRADD